MTNGWARSVAAAVAVVGSAALPVSALVLHPAGDGAVVTRPADAVVGQWLGSNQASLVVVSPDYAVTTQHQGGGIGTLVSIDGTQYKVNAITNHPTADLRVVKLVTLADTPANLTDFVSIYTDTDEAGQTAVFGGYGEGRGSAVAGGYNWAGAGSRSLRWGSNVIDNTGTAGANDVLIADFDSHANGALGEATLATGDSGGGYFLFDSGEWKVAALHRAVANPGQALYSPTPEYIDGVRLSSYSTFINGVVPEPTSGALLLGTLIGLSARRRRA